MLRSLDLTESHVARTLRPVPEVDLGGWLTPVGPGDREAMVARLAANRPPGPLRVFAYGSLIWNPGFAVDRQLPATARGWHRQFCMEQRNWRGTPEAPNLMLALQRGGCCRGLALEVAETRSRAVLADLVRREVSVKESLGEARWIAVETPEGPVRALAFFTGSRGKRFRPGLPLAEVARIIARACGPKGSGADYLRNTVLGLEGHSIHDRNLWTLQRLVAEEIDRL